MPTTKTMSKIERKAMYVLINHPDIVESQTVDEKWFDNNYFRQITSFINMWNGKYTNADQVQAAYGETPFGKRCKNLPRLFEAIQAVDPPTDIEATFKQLRQNYYLNIVRASAQNVYTDPCDFNVNHLINAFNESKEPDTHAKIDAHQVAQHILEELNKPITSFIKSFSNFDNILGGGFLPDELVVIGARPSVGKTAFALNVALQALLGDPNLTVEIFSLEMSQEQNIKRLYSNLSNIPLNFWKNPATRMSDSQKDEARKTITQVYELNLWINDRVTDIDDISQVIRSHAMQCGSGHYLAIVDHIGLVSTSDSRSTPRERIERVSRQLKELTHALKIPIIALSQLNRAVEMRDNNEPNLSDLRETGAIEQDANIVGFLWRKDKDDLNDPVLYLSIKKNRDGELGRLKYYFNKPIQKIAEVSDRE
ncbi:DnaB-like helicase C-terminal domain-containing protein [Lentilactobacillus parabuchneri]|uniref:DnaB-like helicase C-terminal domain-containing protein n=1 Tax=Lentilactobacillus parabuchneri TaxID=152331 RepID=UPI002307CFA4|nr:DnaB-like helicase C-terminal domain-containing protein [Lentilactobacillus parabuchneri]MDB1104771.1 DnaB-like helicase C-terminal domain-containing protein [Lentilactobacillus parabuchneri]